jgi:hypothetical protein
VFIRGVGFDGIVAEWASRVNAPEVAVRDKMGAKTRDLHDLLAVDAAGEEGAVLPVVDVQALFSEAL